MNDFKVNDKVMHCREGLSEITSITTMGDREYFIVHSIHGDGEAIYVPVFTANNIIRHIMTPEEADELLRYLKGIELEFNTNTKQRRDGMKRMLATGDIKDIAYLYYQYHLYLENTDTVKLGMLDIEMLKKAKKYLLDELALAYSIDLENIEEFTLNKIKSL